MTSTNTKDLLKLRAETGLGVVDCKKTLEEANGDYAKALEIAKKKGALKAVKKSEREIKQGVVEAYIHEGKIGAMISLGCETDFVAKNELFKNLAHDLAMQIASMDPKNREELLGQSYIKDNDLTIKDLIEKTIAKTGENIQIIDFVRYSLR